jgi:molybdopterin-guanine dinucleotide biosynthesis protein A
MDRPPPIRLTGLVLAGGMGRRMGGVDKALVPLDGRPLLAHVIERLRPQVSQLLVNANGDPARFAGFGDRVIADVVGDHPGPLAGLHAGLTHTKHPWVLSVPCDAPRLPLDLGARLTRAIQDSGAEIAVARAGGRVHPVFGLLSASLADPLRDYLDGGGRAVLGWIETRRSVVVDFDDADAFTNVNTAEDLACLERESRASGGSKT